MAAPQLPVGENGRPRRLALLALTGSLAIATVLVFAGTGLFFLVTGTNARVSDRLPPDLPEKVYLCDHFQLTRSFVVNADGGRHYQLQGDCPVNPLVAHDRYISELAFRGWTVHDDGANINAFDYERYQALTVTFAESANNVNAATVTIDAFTNVRPIPPDFALPSPG